MKGIHVYNEVDETAAVEALVHAEHAATDLLLLREVAGAIAEARAQGRRQALLDAADEWDANTSDAPALLRELAEFCEACLHPLVRHSREHAIGCLHPACACTHRGNSEADQ